MEAIERMMTYLNKGLADGKSPYTRLTDDAAIAHLELILSADGADSLFSRTYWRACVEQVNTAAGLRSNWQGSRYSVSCFILRLRANPVANRAVVTQ
ncbi:hypothetical protein OKW49_006820 [Paraburkholderia youngii]